MQMNKFKKIMSAVLSAAFIIPVLCGCSKIASITGDKSPVAVYENSEYHFTLTHPSYYSKAKVIPSEDNNDEIRIELYNKEEKANEAAQTGDKEAWRDIISIDIMYKAPYTSIYDFADKSGFSKDKIIACSGNSFAYNDDTAKLSSDPAYYIYAATKRMLYTVRYAYKADDKNAAEYIKTLKFEFDVYANVPKENAFMSPEYLLADGKLSVSVPADNTVEFYPEPPEADENGIVDHSVCNTMTSYSTYSYLAVSIPGYVRFDKADFENQTADLDETEILSSLSGENLQNVKYSGEAEYRENNGLHYRIRNFECGYKNAKASGSVVCGVSGGGKYFEYLYVISNDATEAETSNFNDMIHSIKIK